MAADAGIYSLIRPSQPPADPMAQYGQMMQLRSLMDGRDVAQLQRRKLESELAEEEAVKGFYRNLGGADARGRISDLMAVSPKAGMSAQKFYQDADKNAAELAKAKMETLVKAAGVLKDRLPTVRDEQSYQAYRETALALLGPDQAKAFNLPARFDPEWVRNQVIKADELFTPKMVERTDGQRKWMEDTNPFTNPAIRGGASVPMQMSPSERDASARGWAGISQSREQFNRGRVQYDAERGGIVNLDTGEFKPATQGGAPIGPKDKDPTETQGKAVLFGSRMAASDKILRDLEKGGVTTGSIIKQGAESLPVIGGAAGMGANFLATKDQQLVEQAQRDFINAVLRRESGAVISPEEFANARKQYFGQPGDSPATLAQKQANRALAVKGMETEAGKHAPAIARNVAATRAPSQNASGQITAAPTQADIDAELRRRGIIR